MEMAKPLKSLIVQLETCPLEAFPAHLNENLAWNRPKGDLLHWVPVINRIDEIFENIIKKYGLDNEFVKLDLFSPQDTVLVVACLDFTYTLLENSKLDHDRPIYSSSDRVFDLIKTPTIDVRLKALEVAVLIGERFERTSSSKYSLPKSTKSKVLQIAHSFPPPVPANYNLKFQDNSKKSQSSPTVIGDNYSYIDTININKKYPSKWKHINYSYFKSVMTNNSKSSDQSPKKTSESRKSAKSLTKNEGISSFVLSEDAIRKLSFQQILDRASEAVPKQHWFELSLIAATAKAFNSNSYESLKLREKLLRMKCLSIGFLTCMCNSNYTSSKLFETEPYTFTFLVDIVLPENSATVPKEVFASAIRALQCIALRKYWCSDIIRCMGGNVNHGVLFQCIRHIRKAVEQEAEDYQENVYVYFFVILQFLISTKSLTLRLASGGLLQELMAFFNVRTKFRRTCSAAIKLIAIFLLNSPDSIEDFANNDGFNLIIETLKYEIDFALENPEYDGGAPKDAVVWYKISFRQAEYVLSLMKLVSEIIEADSGDRLRNLFDSPILESFNKILLNPGIFGPDIVSATLDSVFFIIHNEPTAFAILNEAKVIDTILDNYENLFMPSGDLLKALLDILSSICLNKTGLKKVIDKNIISIYFRSFNCVSYAKELVNSDESTSLGSSFDELGRHYPVLKPIIIEESKKLVENFADSVNNNLKGIRFYSSSKGSLYHSVNDTIIENEDGCSEIESWDTADYAYILDNVFFFLGGLLPESGQWGKDAVEKISFDSWMSFLNLTNVPFDYTQSNGFSTLLGILKFFDDEYKDYGFPVLGERLKQQLNCNLIQDYINYEDTNVSFYSRFERDPEAGKHFLVELNTLQLILFTLTEVYINSNLMFKERYQQIVDIFKGESGLQAISSLGLLLQRSVIEESIIRSTTPKTVVLQTEPIYEMFISHPIQIFAEDPANKPVKQEFTSAVFKNTLQLRYFNYYLSNQVTTILSCAGRVCMNKHQDYTQDTWRRDAIEITLEVSKVLTRIMGRQFTNKYFEYCYTLVMSNIALFCMSQKERSRDIVHTSLVVALLQSGFFDVLKTKAQFVWHELLNLEPEVVKKTKTIKYVSMEDSSILKNAVSQIFMIISKSVNSECYPNLPVSKLYFHTGFGKDTDNRLISAILIQTRLVAFELLADVVGLQSELLSLMADNASNIPVPIVEQIIYISKHILLAKKEIKDTNFIPFDVENVSPPVKQVKWLVKLGMTESQANHYFRHGQSLNDFSKQKWPEFPQLEMSLDEWNKFSDLISTHVQNENFDFINKYPTYRNEEDLQLLRFEENEIFINKWIELSKCFPKNIDSIAELFNAIWSDIDEVVIKIFDHVVYLVEIRKDMGHSLARTLTLLNVCVRNDKISDKVLDVFQKLMNFMLSEVFGKPECVNEPYVAPSLVILEQTLLYKEALVAEETSHPSLRSTAPAMPFLISDDMKNKFFDGILKFSNVTKVESITLIVKVLILFAKQYENCIEIASSEIVKEIIRSPKTFFTETDSGNDTLKTYIAILVRRFFESAEVLRVAMTAEIGTLFYGSTRPKRDLQSCLRDTSALVIRDLEIYVDTISKEIRLDGYDGTTEFYGGKIQVIKAKKEGPQVEDVEMKDVSTDAEQNTDPQNSQKLVESSGIIHTILTELMETIKADWVTSPPEKDSEESKTKPAKKGEKIERSELIKNVNFSYASFLVQIITELIASYKEAKLEFLTFSKKRNNEKLKPRSTALNFFIHQLIPTHMLEVSSGVEYERRCVISSLAKFAMLGFLSTPILDEDNSPDGKKENVDMAFIRKYFVDILVKILKETINVEAIAVVRFGKILDILDLVSLMISTKFRESGYPLLNKNAVKFDQYFISKTFLEKDIPAQITNLISEIDLNFPDSDRVTKAALKPLISLGRTKIDYQELFEGDHQGEEDDDLMPDDLDDREETPDLFRNSTLGMYDVETDSEDIDEDIDDGPLEVLISDEEVMESDEASSGLSDLENDSQDEDVDNEFEGPEIEIEQNSSNEDEDDDSVMMGDIEILDGSDVTEDSSLDVDSISENSDYFDEENAEFSSEYEDEELDGWIEEFEDDETNISNDQDQESTRNEDTPIRTRREAGIRRVEFETNEDSDENLSEIESALDLEIIQNLGNPRRTLASGNIFDSNYRAAPSLSALLDSFLGEAGVLRSTLRIGGEDHQFDYRRGINFPYDVDFHVRGAKEANDQLSHMYVKSTFERWFDTKKLFYPKLKDEVVFRVVPAIINRIETPSIELFRKKKEEVERIKQEREERLRKKEEEERRLKEEATREREATIGEETRGEIEPVYVRIGDREVDISGTDIDPEFFEALPDDMREEVFTQHVTERRATATSTGEDAREIDPAFLDALPDQIREEILQHESMARRLSSLEERFDDEFEVAGEDEFSQDSEELDQKKEKKKSKVFFTPLVDRQGISSIIRLLFAPLSLNQREVIYNSLHYLCNNKHSRIEIMGLLIAILYDALINKRTTDKLYSQISARASGQKDVKQYKLPFGSTITIISIQIVEAIDYLLDRNLHLRYYLLTEHENPFIQKIINKRAKFEIGKENKFSINYLLRILDSSIVREEQVFMDLLAKVLQVATRPLHVLQKVNDQDRSLPFSPPIISDANYCQIINILTSNECPNTTFRRAISAMQNLSVLPNAQKVFSFELSEQATALGQVIIEDIAKLTDELKRSESYSSESKLFIKFSSPSSDQAKLLRILTALDYMFETKEKEIEDDSSKANEVREKEIKELTSLYNKLSLGKLWDALSDCLRVFEEKPNLNNVATALLPLIEALMVVCKHSKVKDLQIKDVLRYEAKKVDFTKEPIERLFFSFTDEHKKILNQMVRTNPNLMSGPFGMLVRNPRVLEFDNKKNYFDRKLHQDINENSKLAISIRRDQVFLDSFRALFFKSKDEFRNSKLEINFKGESGVDAGGVTREWYQVLSRQMFNPDYALFTPVASDETTFHPNRTSWVNPEHLSFFKFIGRIIGKAIFDNCFLDCHFSRAVYKRILGRPVSLKDMETLDLDYFKSLMWMLENDITDIITEDFSVETDDYGEHKIIDLIEDGRNIPVIEENKQEYVQKVVEYRLQTSVAEQMDNFLIGFHEIISKELVAIFDEQELELLISGLPDINVDDWQQNTIYNNYSPSVEQIQWFWRAVKSFDNEERAKLLQFATGTSKVPLNGFKELSGANGLCKFSIHRDYGSTERLPSSHTCFNQIDLPAYESYEELRGNLLLAITEGHEGFGLA
jgi:E3 ubiquitin-protein ligase HUWE1